MQCVAVYGSVLQRITAYCKYCSALQFVAVSCSVLQRVVVACCSALFVPNNVLQHIAVC